MSFAPETRLEEALEHLHSLHPKKIDLSLGRLEMLLGKLGHPEQNLPPVLHVAGTNGKGSVVAFMRAILEAAGQSVHVYTSPHLVSFRERIRLGGTLIKENHLLDVLQRVEAANGDDPITFFEVTTAAALVAFSETPADVCLLEVGLGGKLDATNVVDQPLVSVITPVGLDHAEFLGDDLATIAAEKAGIARKGAPVVCAAQAPEARAAIEKITPILLEGRDWQVDPKLPVPALFGDHQIRNAALAVAALSAQDTFSISPADIEKGVQNVQWPARFQRLEASSFQSSLPEGTDIWLDGGHNPLAGGVLAKTLEQTIDPLRPFHVIAGMMTSKDSKGFLSPLATIAGNDARFYAVPIPGEENYIPEGTLADIARGLGFNAISKSSVKEAINQIANEKSAPPQILITGSLYLAGQVLRDINYEIT